MALGAYAVSRIDGPQSQIVASVIATNKRWGPSAKSFGEEHRAPPTMRDVQHSELDAQSNSAKRRAFTCFASEHRPDGRERSVDRAAHCAEGWPGGGLGSSHRVDARVKGMDARAQDAKGARHDAHRSIDGREGEIHGEDGRGHGGQESASGVDARGHRAKERTRVA
jgi:hypothetical protein